MIYSFLLSYLQWLSYLILSLDAQANSIKCLVVVACLPFSLHVLSLLSLTNNLYLDPPFWYISSVALTVYSPALS